jgi:uncharacterized protein
MIIQKNIEIIDVCLFLTKSKTLIIPDVHIGYEEALNKQGILIPRTQFKEIMKKIEYVIKKTLGKHNEIKKIVIIGDLKHEFGKISETEWRQTLKFLDYLNKYCKNIILLKGNHDKILGPIANKRNLQVISSYEIENMMLIHGHKLPIVFPSKIKTIIIGHEHSAVSLKEGPRVEKFKCFLKGKFKPKDDKRTFNLIVLPSFNPIIEGTDVLKEKLLSPFLKKSNIREFEAFIVGDKIYDFGKIKNLLIKK